MNITTKTYQRIDSNGYWIESVTVDPVITPDGEGGFNIEYPLEAGMIEADPSPSPEHRWDGLVWAEPQIVIAPMPEAIMVRQIDDGGYFLADVIIDPVLHDNVWIHPGLDSPDYIQGVIPEGFHKPRYVNGKWIEGATEEEVKTFQPPNWVGFIADFTASDLDEMIAQPTNIANVMRLNRAFGMYPSLNGATICEAWNQCLDGLDTAPNKEQRKSLLRIAEANNLPVTINTKSKMVVTNAN